MSRYEKWSRPARPGGRRPAGPGLPDAAEGGGVPAADPTAVSAGVMGGTGLLVRRWVPSRTGTLVVAALLAGVLVVPSGSAADTAAGTSAAAVVDDPEEAPDPVAVMVAAEVAASELAADTDEPVIVAESMTETRMVTANPDGTFTALTSTEPVRVLQDAGWVDVDATLTAEPGGTIRPAATSLDMTFSGGGTGPLVVLTDDDGNHLEYTWPAALPTPVLAGTSATYPEVLPDVDLVVTADVESFTQVLVVKNAAAAANPALEEFDITLAAEGLQILHTADGNVQAVDDTGNISFQSKTPVMWDSTHNPADGAAPTDASPGTGQITPLDTAVTLTEIGDEATITLTPDETALTGAGVVYPVYIDPTMTATSFKYRVVFKNDATSDYGGTDSADDPDATFRVGCVDSCSPTGTGLTRTFFTVDTAPIAGRTATAEVGSARMFVRQLWNGDSCTDTDVELMSTNGGDEGDGGFNHLATTWPGPDTGTGVLATGTSGSGTNCPAKTPSNVVFADTGTDPLTSYFQNSANNDVASTNFYLRAPEDDTDVKASKMFDPHVYLELTYSFPPDVPEARGILESMRCAAASDILYASDSTPELVGRVTGNNVEFYSDVAAQLMFYVYTPGNPTPIRTSPWINTRTETDVKWAVTPYLPNGNYSYVVRARAYPDSGPLNEASRYSDKVPFTLSIAAPDAPAVRSFKYPAKTWGAPANVPGTITVEHVGSETTTGYAYSWYSEDAIPKVAASTCLLAVTTPQGGIATTTTGNLTLTVPSTLPAGPKTLYIKAFNVTRGASPATKYEFITAPTAGAGNQTEAEAVTATQNLGTYTSSLVFNNAVGTASGGQGKIFHATGGNPTSGPYIGLPFTIGTAGDFAVGIALYKTNHHGTLTFDIVNGAGTATPVMDPNNPTSRLVFDGYSPTTTRVHIPLGGKTLPAGNYTIRVRVTGKNPASTGVVYSGVNDNGYAAAIDLFSIVRLN